MNEKTHAKGRKEPGMELTAAQEIVVKLKAVKSQQNLSVTQIKNLVDSSGFIISESTYRRIFADNGEAGNYSYENTLRPIAQVLLGETGEGSADFQAKIEVYEAIFRYKEELVDSLRQQIDQMKTDYEKRCKEYETRMAFLRDQIELKDQRMDRKDEIIQRLMDKVL